MFPIPFLLLRKGKPMKTFLLVTVTTLATLFAGPAAGAAEAPKEERKLDGDELAKFYLQQILDQVDEEPIVTEQRDLMQELKSLVNRLELQRRERLARQEAEAERQAAERRAKVEAERQQQQGVASSTPAAEKTTPGTVVTLKPVLSSEADQRPMASVLPPMRSAATAADGVLAPTVPAAGAESPEAAIEDDAVQPNASNADSGSGPLVNAADGDADDQTPRPDEERVRSLIRALDQVIARLETLKGWLIRVSQAS